MNNSIALFIQTQTSPQEISELACIISFCFACFGTEKYDNLPEKQRKRDEEREEERRKEERREKERREKKLHKRVVGWGASDAVSHIRDSASYHPYYRVQEHCTTCCHIGLKRYLKTHNRILFSLNDRVTE